MRFAPVSDTKMSPLGATRSRRGFVKPEANRRTVNPAGTDSVASDGCATTFGEFPTDRVLKGAGKSASVM